MNIQKISQTKKEKFVSNLKNSPEYVLDIPYVKKFLSRNSKNPRESTIKKIKNEIRKEQYRISKEVVKDESSTAKKVRSFSIETFEKYFRAREILQPKESVYTATSFKSSEQALYLYMRDNGVSQMQAKEEIEELAKLENSEAIQKRIDRINKIADRTYKIAEKLSKNNKVELNNILQGMRLSDKTNDDWELYVKMRQRQNWIPVRFDINTGRYVKLQGENLAVYKERVKDGYYEQ